MGSVWDVAEAEVPAVLYWTHGCQELAGGGGRWAAGGGGSVTPGGGGMVGAGAGQGWPPGARVYRRVPEQVVLPKHPPRRITLACASAG